MKTQNILFCFDRHQVSETWKALKDTAQYYMDLGSSAFNPSIARYDGGFSEHFIDSERMLEPVSKIGQYKGAGNWVLIV